MKPILLNLVNYLKKLTYIETRAISQTANSQTPLYSSLLEEVDLWNTLISIAEMTAEGRAYYQLD